MKPDAAKPFEVMSDISQYSMYHQIDNILEDLDIPYGKLHTIVHVSEKAVPMAYAIVYSSGASLAVHPDWEEDEWMVQGYCYKGLECCESSYWSKGT